MAITIRPRVYAQSDYTTAITNHMDAVAVSRSYDSALSIATYLSSNNPSWAAEASTFVAWRDAVWLYVYQQLAEVQSHQRSQPTPAELVAELPVIKWPAP